MSEIKQVPISKNLLNVLPPPAEKKPEVVEIPFQVVIEDLQQQVTQLQQTVTFLASFEANLLDSFNKEIAILEEGASITQNDAQKRSFKAVANSLERIRDRWVDGASFHIDRKKMSIVKRNRTDE